MSYSFPKGQANGTEIELANGVTYKYNSQKNTWAVQSVGDSDVFMLKTGGTFTGPVTHTDDFTIQGHKGDDVLVHTSRFNSIKYYGDKSSDQNLATLYDLKKQKEYIDKAVEGITIGSGKKFSGVNVMPSSNSYFATDAAQPKDVKKIYYHPDFLESYIDGPGKRFRRGGWIDLHETSGLRKTLGMYFVYSINTAENGWRYLSVHGMSTVNQNLITNTNYGIDISCSFDDA